MSNNINYWKGEDELSKSKSFVSAQKNEFHDDLPLDEIFNEESIELKANRRDFLKYFGFSVTAVALAACYKTKIRNAIPYLVEPEASVSGVANYFRSTCGACSSSCGIEVKVREGRPIKVDGSIDSPISQGGTCSVGQASILSLYDNERLANPLFDGLEQKDWAFIDAAVSIKLNALKSSNAKIVLLSGSIHSPSTLKSIEKFASAFPSLEHVSYDAISYSGILDANEADFGQRVIPTYKFGEAKVIVSFAADFLGTWISPVEYSKGYTKQRQPGVEGGMSKHIQFESSLSMTGANADHRFPMRVSQEALYVASLYNYIAIANGIKQIPIPLQGELAGNAIKKTAEVLLKSKGKSLVISGSNETEIQQIINGINMLLGNYSTSIDLANHSNQFQGSDTKTAEVLKGLNSGAIGGILFYGVNPVYNHNGKEWVAGIKKAKLSISFSSSQDETAAVCSFVCPDNHYLESWNDAQPRKGVYHFTQPTISNVFNTRQAQISLLTWANALVVLEKDPFASKAILSQKFHASPFYNFMRINWAELLSSDESFNAVLEKGVLLEEPLVGLFAYKGKVDGFASYVSANSKVSGIEMILYQPVGIRDGAHGNNPWLHENPDPVSKVCWDNYIALPKSLAVGLEITEGDTVNITVGKQVYVGVPTIIQPGQANNTVSLALGYGRTHAGKVGGSIEKGVDSVGVNGFAFANNTGNRNFVIKNVEISKGDDTYQLAQTQTHHSIEGRDILRESSLEAWKKSPNAGNDKAKTHVYTIWEKPEYRKDGAPNHLWAMAIDLNSCTGCGSCVVSCSIENNVPIVGREQVRLRREMHWIRIDRYYAFRSKEGNLTREEEIANEDKKGNHDHWQDVGVIYQPMMCQHCANAPCETVCPVLATTHSSEGLNQMTYNRCIGTKYCGNNCPYKVRRFNWFRFNDNDDFDFNFNNPLGKMVINPDVTVRTRGVMEKCSFCVQRIQEEKLSAKRQGKSPDQVVVQTACQRACPSNAIVFGDLRNPESEVSKLYKNERGFTVLEELNIQSSVMYMTKIRNNDSI